MNTKVGFWVMIVLSAGIFGFILLGNQSSPMNKKTENVVTTGTVIPQTISTPPVSSPVPAPAIDEIPASDRDGNPQRVTPVIVGQIDTAH